MTNRIEMMRVLLAAGADPNQRASPSAPSPLETAHFVHNERAIQLLLEHGAVETDPPPQVPQAEPQQPATVPLGPRW